MFWSDSIYLELIIDDYRIRSTKIGRSLVGAGGELGLRPRSSRCMLAARARRSRALAAFILHCKKYMNSYMITAKNYEFIHNMNSYLYEFIYLKCKKYMNLYWIHRIWIHMQYEFILSTGWEVNFFPWNRTINHNICATTTPLHCLEILIF